MANLASNPWSLTSGDVVSQAITSATLNPDGTVTLVAGGVLTATLGVTVIGAALAAYNGYYSVIAGSGTATLTLKPQFSIPAGTGPAGAAGTVAATLYRDEIRVEDISWQNPTAAGQQLDLRDRMGNIVWQATATGAGSQNRGKVFWINGLTPITIQSGVALLTIN